MWVLSGGLVPGATWWGDFRTLVVGVGNHSRSGILSGFLSPGGPCGMWVGREMGFSMVIRQEGLWV